MSAVITPVILTARGHAERLAIDVSDFRRYIAPHVPVVRIHPKADARWLVADVDAFVESRKERGAD